MKVNQDEFTTLSDGLASGRVALISYIATLEGQNNEDNVGRIELYKGWLAEVDTAIKKLITAEIVAAQ